MRLAQRNIRRALADQDVAFAEIKLVFSFVVAVLTGRVRNAALKPGAEMS